MRIRVQEYHTTAKVFSRFFWGEPQGLNLSLFYHKTLPHTILIPRTGVAKKTTPLHRMKKTKKEPLMYPYHRSTQLYATHTREKEAQKKTEEAESLLSQDKRLQELLSLATAQAEDTVTAWESLLQSDALTEAENILNTMYLDGKKHLRILQDAGFLIFGEAPQKSSKTTNAKDDTEAKDTAAALEELLLSEMDDVSFYRALLFAMPQGELWDSFFEILTDKQNHATGLSYLYAKYFG